MSRLTFLNKQCKTLKTWDKQNIFECQACNISVLTYLYAKEASGLSLSCLRRLREANTKEKRMNNY